MITQSSKGGMSVDDLDKFTSPAKIQSNPRNSHENSNYQIMKNPYSA